MNKAGEIRHCALYVRYLASNHCTGKSWCERAAMFWQW